MKATFRVPRVFSDHSLQKLLALTIVLIALLLRAWGIDFGLPYVYHPDEPNYVLIAQNIFKTGDLNPHFFNYPSLFFYLNTLAYIPYYLMGNLIGIFRTPADIPAPAMLAMATGQTSMPSTFLLGRLVTVAFGCAVVGLTYLIGRRLTGNSMAGSLAALLTAVSPMNVANSRYITPDNFLAFFVLLTFWQALQVLDTGETRHYVAAGIAAGLVASTKYNGVVIELALLSAHLLRNGVKGWKDYRLYVAFVLSGLAFFVTTPFALLDHQKFLADLQFESWHYSTGHVGMEGTALLWYVTRLWEIEGPIILFAVAGILRGIYIRSKKIMLLAVFPLAYFVFISAFVVRNDRTILPLTPFLFLLAASFLTTLMAWRPQGQMRWGWSTWVVGALILVSVVLPFLETLREGIRLTTVDSRETARVWIESNLPPGSRIAIESYSPYVDPRRYTVHAFGWMIFQTPEWFVANHIDYLVFSQGIYGRFYAEPNKYYDEIAKYDRFFGDFELVRRFTDGGYEIRIYHVIPLESVLVPTGNRCPRAATMLHPAKPGVV